VPDPRQSLRLNRIERVLDYIHAHLDQPLSVELLAEQSCWSRWQLQRVFTSATGISVAQYIRELRLSRAAELLLDSDLRQLDIALACGIDSEISFSRSFRQMFDCAPRTYRKRGQRIGLRTPIRTDIEVLPPSELASPLLQIRVENRPAFSATGLQAEVSGLFAEQPDFANRVPALWIQLEQHLDGQLSAPCERIGIMDVTDALYQQFRFPYWATVPADMLSAEQATQRGLQTIQVPEQLYAVIPFRGPLSALEHTLLWFIMHWLPDSGYRGQNGFDLEIYDASFRLTSDEVAMEYWVPITLIP